MAFDPNRPDRFEIDWESVPSMETRAASGDPALADPVAARRKVAHALGLTQAETGTERTERFQRALERAGTQPASPGKLRAVVLIATIRGRRRIVGDALWMPLPALVSASDPTDVEILWDEVPGHDAQLMDRIAGSLGAQQARAAQVDAFARRPLPGPPQMRQLAADSAKRALQYVQDPGMRKMLIDQYRAAGIDVGEDEGGAGRG